jgi:hypothetical protein
MRPSKRCRPNAGLLGAFVILGVIQACPSVAFAQATAARDAYERGKKAYEAKDYAAAAAHFARADEISPNPSALESGLTAVLDSNAARLGAELARRADDRHATGKVAELARQAHQRFDGQVARVRLVCASEDCHATIGDRTLKSGEWLLVDPGPIDVEISGHEGTETIHLEVAPGRVTDAVEPAKVVKAPPPPPVVVEPQPPARSSDGISPAVFFTGLTVTTILGGLTVASAVDAGNLRQDFLDHRSAETRDAGQSAVTRTNTLLIGTAAFAVATGIILYFTRWHRAEEPKAAAVRWRSRE